MSNDEKKSVNVSTKLAKAQAEQLKRIVEGMGMNVYQWLQLMAEVTIRMSSDKHNLSEEMGKMIQMFQLVPGFKDVVTFADPHAKGEVCEAVYIFQGRDKKGFKPVLVQKPYMGEFTANENVMDIVERVIEVCNPTAYKRLRVAMVELKCSRIFEALMVLADSLTIEKLNEMTIGEMFTDNNRYDAPNSRYGSVVEYGKKTKSVHHKTVDQQTLRFDE